MKQIDILMSARKKLYIFKEVYDLGGTAKELLDEIDGQLFLLEELMTIYSRTAGELNDD